MMPKLYMNEVSPAVRAVLMTAKALNITLDLKEVNLQNKEQLAPEFLKLNPQHTVPTLEDNGLVIWDSHAIIAYLVGKYGAYDSYYSKDIQKRAVIDQRLHFDSEVVSHVLKTIMSQIIRGDSVEIRPDFKERINRVYALVETFLVEDWIAGSSISIADFSILASITTLHVISPIEPLKYPKVIRWIQRAQMESFYDSNKRGLEKLESLICCKEGLEQ
ncbi:glutathione S-transferase 1-like [Coccinella septempunctata]|uniref:glutathione S-transferase 1-like n=1 Tax=Coccinella septempunctata TaxID=41139 RepID=UPI001D077232|nr:glutathione S-transferase 1-like [Coccinella septempunctata]